MISSAFLPEVFAWFEVKGKTIATKAYAQQVRDRIVAATNPYTVRELDSYIDQLTELIVFYAAQASVPGIVGAARDIENDQLFEPITEGGEFRSRLIALRQTIYDALPQVTGATNFGLRAGNFSWTDSFPTQPQLDAIVVDLDSILAHNTLTNVDPAVYAWRDVKFKLAGVRRALNARNTGWKAGTADDVNIDQILLVRGELRRRRNIIAGLVQTTGIGAAARAVEQDPTFSVSTEIGELNSRLLVVKTAIEGAVPTDGGGKVIEKSYDPDDVPVFDHPGQTELDTLTAAIDNLLAYIGV